MEGTRKIFFDTETTSLKPGQICQLSIIVEDNLKVTEAKNYFFTVDSIDPKAQEVHGLSKELLLEKSAGKRFEDYAQEIYYILASGKLIAHNIKFDESFVSAEFWRAGIAFTPLDKQCTMELFKDVLKIPNKYPKYGKYKNPNLGEVARAFNVNEQMILKYSNQLFGSADITFHDARFDTTAMYVVTNIYREKLIGGIDWQQLFCKA